MVCRKSPSAASCELQELVAKHYDIGGFRWGETRPNDNNNLIANGTFARDVPLLVDVRWARVRDGFLGLRTFYDLVARNISQPPPSCGFRLADVQAIQCESGVSKGENIR